MPGPGSYGPAGKWIHDRAHGIMEDGKTPKDVAYAVATHQAHKMGKSPKGFRTAAGVREAKKKYDSPQSAYQKTAQDAAKKGSKQPQRREQVMPQTTKIAAFLDELEKIGVDAAMAMEGMGIPGAMYAGYKKSGLKGLGSTGLGAIGGLGLGALGTHMVSKMTANSPFLNRHPIVKAIADSTPIGLGGVMGGAVGEHYAGHGHKTASLAGRLLKKVSKSPIIAADVVDDVGSIPARYRRYEDALQKGQPAGMVPLNMLPIE